MAIRNLGFFFHLVAYVKWQSHPFSKCYYVINPFWAGTRLGVLSIMFYALTVEKQQIYKLISRHRVARYELCRSAVFEKLWKMWCKFIQKTITI